LPFVGALPNINHPRPYHLNAPLFHKKDINIQNTSVSPARIMGCIVYKLEGNVQHADEFLCLFWSAFSNNIPWQYIAIRIVIQLSCILIYCNTLLPYRDIPNTYLRLSVAGSRHKVLNMIKTLSETDFALAITQNFGDQSHGVHTTLPKTPSQFGRFLVVTRL
jgi:hypothetical protein